MRLNRRRLPTPGARGREHEVVERNRDVLVAEPRAAPPENDPQRYRANAAGRVEFHPVSTAPDIGGYETPDPGHAEATTPVGRVQDAPLARGSAEDVLLFPRQQALANDVHDVVRKGDIEGHDCPVCGRPIEEHVVDAGVKVAGEGAGCLIA